MWPYVGCNRTYFSVCHEYGDKYLYILGGQNSSIKTQQKLKTVSKLNLYTLEWEEIAFLQKARSGLASFISKNGKFLYAFAGGCNSVERLDLFS